MSQINSDGSATAGIRAEQSDAPEKATSFQISSLKLDHKTMFIKFVGSLRIALSS